MPHLDAINSKYEGKGVQVVVIDITNSKELTQKVVTEAAYKAPVLVDDKEFARKEYSIVATPTTYPGGPGRQDDLQARRLRPGHGEGAGEGNRPAPGEEDLLMS